MKKLMAIALAVVMAAAVFAGCSAAPQQSQSVEPSKSAESSSAAPSPSESASASESASPSESASAAAPIMDAIKAKGTIIVGCEAQYAPFEYHKIDGGKDEIVGSDIDLANEIAKQLGVKLEIKDLPFDTLITALNTNKIDLVISAIEPNDERKTSADFTDAYYDAGSSVIIRKEDEAVFVSIDSLKGKKVGAQLGSTQESIVKSQMAESSPVSQEKIPDMGLALKSKKLDALVVDTLVAQNFVKANPELIISSIALKSESPGYAIALNKGDAQFLAFLNGIIKELKDSGKIQESIDKANADSAE